MLEVTDILNYDVTVKVFQVVEQIRNKIACWHLRLQLLDATPRIFPVR